MIHTAFREKKKKASKESYYILKKIQTEKKKEEKIENDKKWARDSFDFKKKVATDLIYLWRKKFHWIVDYFQHFMETFPEADDAVKSDMMAIEKDILQAHEKMEKQIDERLNKIKKYRRFR